MLDRLLGSQARAKILKIFLLNPHTKYYVRQLARQLGLQVNAVRRELDNLIGMSLILAESAKKENDSEGDTEAMPRLTRGDGMHEKKYYRANLSFPLFEEIQAVFVKSHILYKNDFVDHLRTTGDVRLIVLAGFFVNDNEADVDLMIVGNINKTKFQKVLKDMEDELGREINFTSMDLKEFQYRHGMADAFLYKILGGRKMIAYDPEGVSR